MSHYTPFLLIWYNSFFCGRVHSSLVNDQLSRELTLSQGVPQGTVNGPPFFNRDTNDISVTTDIPERRCRLTKFADDFTPVVGGRIGENECSSDVINALEVQYNAESRKNKKVCVIVQLYSRNRLLSLILSLRQTSCSFARAVEASVSYVSDLQNFPIKSRPSSFSSTSLRIYFLV